MFFCKQAFTVVLLPEDTTGLTPGLGLIPTADPPADPLCPLEKTNPAESQMSIPLIQQPFRVTHTGTQPATTASGGERQRLRQTPKLKRDSESREKLKWLFIPAVVLSAHLRAAERSLCSFP